MSQIPEHDAWAVGRALYGAILAGTELHKMPRELWSFYFRGIEVQCAAYMEPGKVAFLHNGQVVGLYDLEAGECVAFQKKAEAEVPTLQGQGVSGIETFDPILPLVPGPERGNPGGM